MKCCLNKNTTNMYIRVQYVLQGIVQQSISWVPEEASEKDGKPGANLLKSVNRHVDSIGLDILILSLIIEKMHCQVTNMRHPLLNGFYLRHTAFSLLTLSGKSKQLVHMFAGQKSPQMSNTVFSMPSELSEHVYNNH